jgi:hypothetical protein
MKKWQEESTTDSKKIDSTEEQEKTSEHYKR